MCEGFGQNPHFSLKLVFDNIFELSLIIDNGIDLIFSDGPQTLPHILK